MSTGHDMTKSDTMTLEEKNNLDYVGRLSLAKEIVKMTSILRKEFSIWSEERVISIEIFNWYELELYTLMDKHRYGVWYF